MLSWDPSDAQDFAYFKVYSGQDTMMAQATLVGTTVETQMDLAGINDPWVFVSAVDDANLESAVSTPTAVSDVPRVVNEVGLSNAVPNPFNPETKIGYALPSTGKVRLSVFDLSGRLNSAVQHGSQQVDATTRSKPLSQSVGQVT